MGPFVTLEICQFVIWGVQRLMVRPSWLISGGHEGSWKLVCEPEGVLESEDRTLDPVDVSDGFLRVPRGAHLPVGITSTKKTAQVSRRV